MNISRLCSLKRSLGRRLVSPIYWRITQATFNQTDNIKSFTSDMRFDVVGLTCRLRLRQNPPTFFALTHFQTNPRLRLKPAKVLLTVTFSIWSILTNHDLFGSDVEQDWSLTVFAVVFFFTLIKHFATVYVIFSAFVI